MPQVGLAIAGLGTAFAATAPATAIPWVAAAGGGALVGGAATSALFTQLAVGVGLTGLQMALAPKPGAPKRGTRISVGTGETGAQTIILGRFATAGELVFIGSHGGGGTDRNENLVQVFELSDWPVSALRRVWVNGEWVEFKASPAPGFETRGLPVRGYEAKGRDRLWVKFYDGTQTTADAQLLQHFSDPYPAPWDANMVGRGIAYAIVTANWTPKVHSQRPECLFELDGAPLYDPRRDSTVGGSGPQRLSRPATWAATDNPAVMIYNILLGLRDPITGAFVWGGQGISQRDLPFPSWKAAMDECDRVVGGAPQYRAGMEVPLDAEPAAVIEDLLRACAGSIQECAGQWTMKAGKPGDAVYAFSDEDLIVTAPETFEQFPGLDETYNGVRATYPRPAAGWRMVDAPPRENEAHLAADGGRRNVADLSYSAVWAREQVERLMSSALKDGRRFRRHTLVLPPEARRLAPGDEIAWTSPRHFYTAKLFEVTFVEDNRNGNVSVALRERDPSDYDPPDGILPDTGFTAKPGRGEGVVPFSVEPAEIIDAASQARRAAIRLRWSYTESEADAIRYRVRLAATQAHLPIEGQAADVEAGATKSALTLRGEPLTVRGQRLTYSVFSNVGAGSALISAGLLGATAYEVQAIAVPTTGRRWSDWLPVTTPNVKLTLVDFDDVVADTITDAAADAALAKTQAAAALAAVDGISEGALEAVQDLLDQLSGIGTGTLTEFLGVSVAGSIPGWSKDPIFWAWASGVPSAWSNVNVGAFGARDPSGYYGSGLLINATAGAQAVSVSASSAVAGQLDAADPNAPYVAVTVLVRYFSGSLDGFRLRPEWQATGSTTWVRGHAFGANNAEGSAAQWGVTNTPELFRSATVIWRKPFAGAASAVRLQAGAKAANTPNAVSLRFDVLQIRAATEGEVKAFEAAGDAQARVDALAAQVTDAYGAAAAFATQASAAFGSTSAAVTALGTAAASAERAETAYVIRAVAGGGSAGLRIVAWDNETSVGGAVVLDGSNVIAPGTLSAGEIVVGDFGFNAIPDNQIQSPTCWTNSVLQPGPPTPAPTSGWGLIRQSSAAGLGSVGELRSAPGWTGETSSLPFAVRPGQQWTFSARIGRVNGTGHSVRVVVRWLDSAGGVVGAPQVGAVTSSSTAVQTIQNAERLTVPDGATQAILRVVIDSVTGAGAQVRFWAPTGVRRTNASAIITPDRAFFDELATEEAWIGTLNVRDGAFGRAYDAANTSSFEVASGSWTTLAARTMPANMVPNYRDGTPRTARALVSATTLYGTEDSPTMEFRCLVNGVQQFYISISHGAAQVERVRPYTFAVDVRNGWAVQWQCRRTGGTADHRDTRLGMVILFASADA